ncbi:hypothetical protein P692DRAFT_20830679 [Suillus brevipes Sb2]|nr:hypothetical protein P692DRAFT_20830679 [Suillus brevipes Sb2]
MVPHGPLMDEAQNYWKLLHFDFPNVFKRSEMIGGQELEPQEMLKSYKDSQISAMKHAVSNGFGFRDIPRRLERKLWMRLVHRKTFYEIHFRKQEV